MIIVFGSNVLDMFFETADLPAHDTALHLETHIEAPGGKGANQAVAAARAGAKVKFFGTLGEGGHGRQMYKNLGANGIDVSGITITTEAPSAVAAIFVDKADGTHKVIVSQGANRLARQDSIKDDDLTSQTTLLLQGELAIAETEKLISRAKQKGGKVIINLAPVVPISKEALQDTDILIVNEHEAETLGRQHGLEVEDKPALGKAFYEKFKLTTIITMGGKGAICCQENGYIVVPTLSIKPVDTIGAGDAFSGFLAAAIDQGLDFEQALIRASIAGALTCTKIGAQSALPTDEEIQPHLKSITLTHHKYS